MNDKITITTGGSNYNENVGALINDISTTFGDTSISTQNQCPEFPFWGASYPDACCIDGKLYDLDRCDDNGLHEPIDDIPCPFCKTEEFIELDHFGKVDAFLDELMEDDSAEQYDIHIDEAKEKAREWYLKWIEDLKNRY